VDEITVMREAFREMAAAQGADAGVETEADDIDKTVGADLRFHKAILAGAGNHFLATFGALIGSSLIASFRLNWQAHNSAPALSIALHEDVLSAIASRNAQAAEDCMRVLLTAAHRDARLSLASKPVKADPAAIQ